MSVDEKHASVPPVHEKNHGVTTDVESANELPPSEFVASGTLKRQLKNRHIAMIRYDERNIIYIYD